MTMTRSAGAVGILGGTFDPIHIGHLRLGEEALQQLALDQIRFVPAGRPPLRDVPSASPEQRLAMVKFSIADNPRFVIDDQEVLSDRQSYTVETLERLREEIGATRPLVLLLGQDAFERLENWHRWRDIFSLAHIAVANRNGVSPTPTGKLPGITALPLTAEARANLYATPAGQILFFPIPSLEISATDIRTRILAGHSVRHLLVDNVVRYIESHHLYR